MVTPTTLPSPTLSAIPRLDNQLYRITVTIDANTFLNDNSSATNAFDKKIMSQSFLKNRRVGFVIAYGGAPDNSSIQTALTIASKVYSDLRQRGNRNGTLSIGQVARRAAVGVEMRGSSSASLASIIFCMS